MRPALLLLTLVSLPAAAQSAAQVCGTILYSDQKVACVRAIAGHDVEPEAAQVCGTILYADQIVRCMSSILDKHYEADELSACRTILYADQKADCMSAAGQARKVASRRRERDRAADDDVADDEEEAPRRARFDSTVTFDNRTSRATVNRFYWRLPGRGRWTEFGGRRRLPGQEQVSLEAASGLYDFCVETTDGRSAYWARIRLEASEHRLFFKSDQLEALDCRDR
jgi:hypothetical protein